MAITLLPSCSNAGNSAAYIPLIGMKEKTFLQTIVSSRGTTRTQVTYRWNPEEKFEGILAIPINYYKENQLISTYYMYEKKGSVYSIGSKDLRKRRINIYSPHFLELIGNLKEGANWSQTYTIETKEESGEFIESKILKSEVSIVGKDDVTVPAGTYISCIKVDFKRRSPSENARATQWKCKDMGLVKSIYENLASGVTLTLDLISYQKEQP